MRFILDKLLFLSMFGLCGLSWAHGLIESPPSRNWYCGVITKPDEVINNVAEFPECGNAFATGEFSAGYQFMSVLTHDVGRTAVTPLPEQVCGFASESFNSGATPWDAAIDWPTTTMNSGYQEIKWNIQWGPYFDDTEEFRYWITRPDFQFDPAKPLTWDDFEATEFCVLTYDDSRPNDNPDVIPLKETTQFRTFCNVPERQGRHVIYGEWGRNHYTFERFHGCIDAVFDDYSEPQEPITAVISEPNIDVFVGQGVLTLDASKSKGDNQTYLWSISAPDDSMYTITDPNQAVTTLLLAEPNTTQNVELSLMVSNDNSVSSAQHTFLHEIQISSAWVDLGPLTDSLITLQAGDAISIRTISGEGIDRYYPATPLVLNTDNAVSDVWPAVLADLVNRSTGAPIAVGVLGNNDQVTAVKNALNNRIYRLANEDVVSVFLQIEYAQQPPPGTENDCVVTLRDGANPWWAGMDIATNKTTITLDFSATGLNLGHNLIVDSGNFMVNISGQKLSLTKPFWVTIDQPGYLGFNADNNPALADFNVPLCSAL